MCSQIDQINSYSAKGEAAIGTAQRAAAVSQSMAFSENQVPKIRDGSIRAIEKKKKIKYVS